MIVNGLVISLIYGIDRSVSSFVWGETKTTKITFGVRHPVGQPSCENHQRQGSGGPCKAGKHGIHLSFHEILDGL